MTPATLCRNGLHPMVGENVIVRELRAHRTGKPYTTRTCRECYRARDRERYQRDRDKRRALGDKWYAERTERDKRADRLRKFGITPERYDAMLEAQGGGCAICGTAEPGGRWGTYFAVDHCHTTGEVRGLLCGRCNVMLGNAQDDAGRLELAAAYLRGAEH